MTTANESTPAQPDPPDPLISATLALSMSTPTTFDVLVASAMQGLLAGSPDPQAPDVVARRAIKYAQEAGAAILSAHASVPPEMIAHLRRQRQPGKPGGIILPGQYPHPN